MISQPIVFAKIRFLKSIREPFTAIMLIFNLIAVFVSSLLPLFTFDPMSEMRAHLEIAFQSTFVISLIVAAYHASQSIQGEIEDRTIFTILSKPISRFSYLFGNLIGIMSVTAIFYVLSFILTDFMLFLEAISIKERNYSLSTAIFGYLSRSYSGHGVEHVTILPYFLISWSSCLPLLAIAVCLSPFTSFLMNLSLCSCVYALGNLLPTLDLTSGPWTLVRQLPPRMDLFDLTDSLVLGSTPGTTTILLCLLYAGTYSLFWLTVGSMLLARKEFA